MDFSPSIPKMQVHIFAFIHILSFIINNIHTFSKLKYRSLKSSNP